MKSLPEDMLGLLWIKRTLINRHCELATEYFLHAVWLHEIIVCIAVSDTLLFLLTSPRATYFLETNCKLLRVGFTRTDSQAPTTGKFTLISSRSLHSHHKFFLAAKFAYPPLIFDRQDYSCFVLLIFYFLKYISCCVQIYIFQPVHSNLLSNIMFLLSTMPLLLHLYLRHDTSHHKVLLHVNYYSLRPRIDVFGFSNFG